MTETQHTRSRRVSLYGLLLQLVVFAGVLALAQVSGSLGLLSLAWYIAGGVPIWFVCLLVFRQRELVALEALDLEELRRERQATGGGEAIFDEEGGGGLGFRVAQARLNWMQRYLIPTFGLLSAVYLVGMGLYLWYAVRHAATQGYPTLTNLPIAMIVLAVVMLVLFLFARFTSGMGRVREWQLLRACGSYVLGNALGALLLIGCLGVYLYTEVATAERALAYAIPVVMFLLAAETLANFILDAYRPRTRAVEPRACFDSRLLALIAEPGGIASTIAEAINYQFGFEVTQTWFYQLLQRTFVPLMGVGLVILWLLTCVLVVQPGESALIERFGRQLNAHAPYVSGFYWKLPWPIDVARKYNTGQLHQLIVGFKQFDAEPKADEGTTVALWSDEQHLGQPHFDFLVPVPPGAEERQRAAPLRSPLEPEPRRAEQALPVNMVRTDVAIQYKIREDGLAAFTQQLANPHDTMRDIAWEEVVRYTAARDIFTLLGKKYGTAGAEIQERIRQRADALHLGLDIVYVGVQNVHPEPNVSKEFRKVVTAEQEKIASIREARVRENQILSAVAGDRETARSLTRAIENLGPNTTRLDRSEQVLSTLNAARVKQFEERLAPLEPQFRRVAEAQWRLVQAEEERKQVDSDFELGLGQNVADQAVAAARVTQAEQALAAAERERDEALAPIVAEAQRELGEAGVAALRDRAAARVALDFWNGRIEQLLPDLQGEAAAMLAAAQADRWSIEMGAASEVARVLGERGAYHAAPRTYKIRKYLDVLVQGIQDSRKFFLAFDPRGRTVRVRFMAEEQARSDIQALETRRNP